MKTTTSFGKFAKLWDAKVGEDGSNIEAIQLQIPIFFDMLGKVKGKHIYEIACGNGFLARQLAKAGAQVTASDVSPELLKLQRLSTRAKALPTKSVKQRMLKVYPKITSMQSL